ncbi:sensor histidine kinase [Croceicoccus gelatinilyticus]|uniref:sensor histidine kinase n=1 Tax=Croceicoccus gelatinilyticus TaxID=2835536 RepID=UPI00308006C3
MKPYEDNGPDPHPHAAVGLPTVLISMVILWTVYFALATARGVVLGFDMQMEMLSSRVIVSIAGIAVTVLLWLLLRGFDRRSLGLRIVVAIVAAAPASLLLAFINQQAFADIEERNVKRIGDEQGISIRRDEAGNLLVDVPDIPAPPEAPPPPMPGDEDVPPPAPPAPDVPAEHAAAQTVIASPGPEKLLWQQLTDIALGRYYLLLSWCAIYIALGQAVQARMAERRAGEHRRAAKAAELKSLRYQVNPHFLFNTLNSLSALVMTNRNEQAETMIQMISRFYRRSLSGDPTHDVPLEEEIELQRIYLQIEAVRFPDRLVVDIDVPPELAKARIPGMILQPLIENSVRYAVALVNRPVTIRLAASEEYERLVVTVTDDGPGASSDEHGGFGIGLANVRDRLKARFGKEASVASGPGEEGWRTVIRMPLKFSGEED